MACAKKVEREIYENANDKLEYFKHFVKSISRHVEFIETPRSIMDDMPSLVNALNNTNNRNVRSILNANPNLMALLRQLHQPQSDNLTEEISTWGLRPLDLSQPNQLS